ncbi:MAG TPA: hypothetical protein ENK21_03695, partial [Trueperaceae bacterium]|nr:hypothetical protein [Trueperaceae bacterium]
ANLPYGKRIMSEAEAKKLGADFAKNLKENYQGSYFSLITTDSSPFNQKDFKFSKTNFTNGGLKVTLIQGMVG